MQDGPQSTCARVLIIAQALPPGLVGSLRAISGFDGFPSEPCFGTMGPRKAPWIARLSRIGARRPHGPSGAPSGPNRPLWTPLDPVSQEPQQFWRPAAPIGVSQCYCTLELPGQVEVQSLLGSKMVGDSRSSCVGILDQAVAGCWIKQAAPSAT